MRLLAVGLVLASLLPLANWIPGGEVDPGYAARVSDWLLGTALCAGIGGLVWFLRRRRATAAVPPAVGAVALSPERERVGAVCIAAAALVCYGLIATQVFSGRPLLIDEIVQVLQARDLAAGRLTHVHPGPDVFFSILHEVELGGRAFGQYPVGGPAMLLPGVLLGAAWLVGPLAGAWSVLLFWYLLRLTDRERSPRFRLGATALFAAAPFGAFMFGSHMNHATALLWVLLATLALARATSGTTRAPWWGLLTGACLGIAATIRPLDAGAFALPAAAWLLWRARAGGRPFVTLLLSGVGVALPMALAFWANEVTTGHPLTFGYDLLWGPGHALGFHATPWGAVHTPLRGVELIGLYLTRLNTYLFELPFPSLLLAAVGLWVSRGLGPMERYLLASAGLVAVGYWAYWHDGFFLGPRFLFAWLPAAVLWSARGLQAMWSGATAPPALREGARAALLAGAAYGIMTLVVERIPSYRNGMQSLRVPATAARDAGVADALVLVQESWGAQLVVRMWEAGISRPDTEVLYRTVDACVLEEALQRIRGADMAPAAALESLRPLMADSSRLLPSDVSPDFTERRLPGLAYTRTCIARIEDDRRGYLLYAPWRLVADGNVYARWLPGREAEIAGRFPGRPVYLLRRDGTAIGAPLHWERLSP